MERVAARVDVVHYYVDDLIFLQDEGTGVFAVDLWLGGEIARGQDGVEGWDFSGGVGYVVEEGADGGG